MYSLKLNILFLNVRSALHKAEHLELMLNECHSDLLCIAETWLNESKMQCFKMCNYCMVSHFNRTTLGGGVAAIMA